MSKITLIIIIFIIILAIYFLVSSGFFKSKPEKVENEVAGHLEVTYDSIEDDYDENTFDTIEEDE